MSPTAAQGNFNLRSNSGFRSAGSRVLVLLGIICLGTFCFSGCIGSSPEEVVVYTALDREFSESILNDFAEETSIKVLPKYDKESNKTVGLTDEIINQQARQRADLFWNNEILHTLRLKRLGLLEVYPAPLAADYPAQFVSPDSDWHGFAARARVLIVNTEILPDPETWPRSVSELADAKWEGRCCLARPLFGTSSTHAAVLFATLGAERAKEFYRQVKQNAAVEGGNKQVAIHVAEGRYAFGLTDTDDAIIEIEKGNPVAIVFPDQDGEDAAGALLIPNTLAIVKDGPNYENATRLVDWLLRSEIEDRLAECPSAQIPLGTNATQTSRVEPESLKPMQVDFEKAADQWELAKPFLLELFQ